MRYEAFSTEMLSRIVDGVQEGSMNQHFADAENCSELLTPVPSFWNALGMLGSSCSDKDCGWIRFGPVFPEDTDKSDATNAAWWARMWVDFGGPFQERMEKEEV